jgi:hypothetical protein
MVDKICHKNKDKVTDKMTEMCKLLFERNKEKIMLLLDESNNDNGLNSLLIQDTKDV